MIRAVHSNLLYVGNAMDARDLRSLYDNGIHAVIDLAINEPPAQLGREIIYCRFPMSDGDGNSDALITLAIHTTTLLIQHKIRTIVACSAGMSRAPSIAAASIAVLMGHDPDDCLLRLISGVPNDVSPILWTHVKRVLKING